MLLVGGYECGEKHIKRVRRTKPVKRSRDQFEVCVRFVDKEVRDYVSSHGRNLADYKTDEDLPTAATRFDYPSYQGQDFRLLEWYGRQMQIKHGRGTRRNFEYDDDEESIYLEICLPGEDYWFPDSTRRGDVEAGTTI